MKNFWLLAACLSLFLYACAAASPEVSAPAAQVTDLAGEWAGTIINSETGEALVELQFVLYDTCEMDAVCGTYAIPGLPCEGNLVYNGAEDSTFTFTQYLTVGEIDTCGTESVNQLTLQKDGTLSQTWQDGNNQTHADLTRQ